MKIYVVGIGAGSADGMTFEARNVLEKADVIVGVCRACEKAVS